ncbi:uncharacterized protein [Parasteatoda tepidariorum]|uniref:uncharacterized protein n=1 Tax=Parasteatoda tepidariorum TaxID=114398 RepID=UPI001C72208C|nr:uncharacterized protein LOC122272577 [Parasteatoda tepidariorum]
MFLQQGMQKFFEKLSSVTPEFIAPLILPSKHLVITRLIEQEHLLNKHAGTSILLTILRERFWIIKGRRTVRSVIRGCVTYKRQKVKNLEVPFPPLPPDRTRLSAVFEVSGVDLAGPLMTKTNRPFLLCSLRRSIARRGRISTPYSDNGTNFTGLNASLKRLDWNKIMKEFEVSQIQWKFNPPSAPWWGGFWERLIGILKDLLRKNLGRSSLTHEELSTLVCE